ncbi:MAG TPA: MASE1 domain-containing protein, partial [Vicinamibacterales bacterium]|nr:MASE1 domain-containing protein [Vicinamibacterales bacterium]
MSPITHSSETRRRAIAMVAVVVAYAATARLGFQVAFLAEQVTTVWAPTGIAQAALLLWGPRLWPAVWLGAFIANVGTTAPIWTAAVIAIGNTLEAVVAAWLLRRDAGFDAGLRRLRDVARLIVIGAIVATTISATVGVATLCLASVQPWTRFGSLWSAWWLGDALGALVVAPVLLTISRYRRQPIRGQIGMALMVLGCVTMTQVIFGPALGATFGEGLLHYIVFPVVVVAAVRLGQPATALVILGVSAVAIWNTIHGAGPFASADVQRSLVLLQAFIGVLAGTGLMLSAAMAERSVAETAIVEEQRRTRAILDSALDAVIAIDHRGVITEFNPAAERAFGYRRDEALGKELADLIIPPDLRGQHRAGLAHYMATGYGPFVNRRVETRGYHADGHEFPIEVAITAFDDAPPRFTGFVRDLTARRLAEEAIRTSEERFRRLAASNSSLTLYEQDRELRYRWVFPQHPEFPDHNIGKTDEELLPPGEGDKLTAIKRDVLETGVGRREEVTVTLPSDVRSYDLTVEPRRDSSGAIVGVSGVAVDITERKRTEQRLLVSEAQLREADRHKDEFLAMLAHELRNPLAPIRTGLHLIHLAGDTPEAVGKVREMMERQVGHMVRLIDDLLDVSRISSGKFNLQRQPTPLIDLINGAIEANRGAIDAAGVTLTVQLPDRPVMLAADPTRLVQVLSNLLNNAVKFTPRDGRITVSGEVVRGAAGADEVRLSVADTGKGISSEMLPRVFELFSQDDRGTDRQHGGLGIGLALARRIVEMHGGRIEASSAGEGRGSAFTIHMPLHQVPVEGTTAAPAAPSERSAIGRRVLIVDDNVDSADAMAAIVRMLGGEAETANGGREGIERGARFAPHIVFLDIGMPEMD